MLLIGHHLFGFGVVTYFLFSRRFLLGRVLIVILLFIAAPKIHAQDASTLAGLTNDFKIRLWNPAFALRGTLGFKDNPLLSPTNRIATGFWESGGDIILYRLPTGPWQINILASGSDTRYFGGDKSVGNDQMAIAAVQATRRFGTEWTSRFGANYVYQNQVTDLLDYGTNQGVGRLTGNLFTGQWLTRGDFTNNWVEMELAGTRYLFKAPLDNTTGGSLRLAAGHRFGTRSEISLSYRLGASLLDNSPNVDANGQTIKGSSLYFLTHTIESAWNKTWDAQSRWTTTLSAGIEDGTDNGAGYFDFLQFYGGPKIEYRASTWNLVATTRISYYDFAREMVSQTDRDIRWRTVFSATLRWDKTIRKGLKGFVQYSYDRSLSNDSLQTYKANVVSSGIEWQF